MRNDAQKGHGLFSKKSLSGYLKIVSSGASTVASTVKTAGVSIAASIADAASVRDQVHWSGFDKIEGVDGATREVLLLAYKSGFEVWDVDGADDVHQLASRRDGPVSFMQILRSPIASTKCKDNFADFRPLLVIAGDGSCTGVVKNPEIGLDNFQGQGFGTNIQFYSLKIHSYVHYVKFRSPVYSIRSGPRVLAVCQASQIHCFDALTLERNYTFLTHPVVSGSAGSVGIGYGPLAVGPRWLAYSGNPITDCSGRINPQLPDAIGAFSFSPINGSLVAHYAKESGKQFVSGIATLGDLGYKKLTKYCSEHLSDGYYSRQGSWTCASNGTSINSLNIENAGMVIVRDIVSRSVIAQFRAHSSPICALCFDPSGTLLATASIYGHNINIFRIMPSHDASGSYAHLYKLQRGLSNAVIQDISFSVDSRYVTVSSSKGTSHLFELTLYEGMPDSHPCRNGFTSNVVLLGAKAPVWHSSRLSSHKINMNTFHYTNMPITLSAITRIRNGCNGWRDAVTDVATAAAGKISSPCGPISSTFHNSKSTYCCPGTESASIVYHILVFSSSGCLTQYVMRHSSGDDNPRNTLECDSNVSSHDVKTRLVVEALQKWDICHKQNRRDNPRTVDIYENGGLRNSRFLANGKTKGTTVCTAEEKKCTIKIDHGEGHNMYISEIELHTHPPKIPLWAKQEISFHMMMDIPLVGASSDNAEIEIERISARTITARSKDLIPASEYSQMPGCQHSRSDLPENTINEQSALHGSSFTEAEKVQSRSSFFPDVLTCTELSGIGIKNECGIHPSALQTNMDSVKSRNISNVTSVKPVDKVMVPTVKSPLVHVHTTENPKLENLFLDGDNDID